MLNINSHAIGNYSFVDLFLNMSELSLQFALGVAENIQIIKNLHGWCEKGSIGPGQHI